MRILRLGVAALALAAAAAVLPAAPAGAHTNAGACVFTGTANVNPGLTVGLPINAAWNFTSDLDVCVVASGQPSIPGAGNVGGYGTLFGLCGGSSGQGNVQIMGDNIPVIFATVGGTGVLVGAVSELIDPALASGHTAAAVAATFQARPLPSVVGAVPCVTEPATKFLIVGAGAAGAVD